MDIRPYTWDAFQIIRRYIIDVVIGRCLPGVTDTAISWIIHPSINCNLGDIRFRVKSPEESIDRVAPFAYYRDIRCFIPAFASPDHQFHRNPRIGDYFIRRPATLITWNSSGIPWKPIVESGVLAARDDFSPPWSIVQVLYGSRWDWDVEKGCSGPKAEAK